MRLCKIYDFAIKKGLENDPRSGKAIKKAMAATRTSFRKLKGPERAAFDTESLRHPYADTRILHGDADTEVRKMMVGIDIDLGELLIADRLNQRGEGIDLVMAHHPAGIAYAGFYNVMHIHEDILRKFGISQEVAKDLTKERMDEVERRVSPANHMRSVDGARLLEIPFMCVHTPADNHVTNYLQRLFDKEKPRRLSGVVDLLKSIPEYNAAMSKKTPPRILIGSPEKRAGKVFVDMTGGTEGSKRIFPRLSQAGVSTIVAMHLSEEHFKRAKSEYINIVIAGHIASDTLGLNLLLDALVKKGDIEILPCSGFVRVRR